MKKERKEKEKKNIILRNLLYYTILSYSAKCRENIMICHIIAAESFENT
jgi:hypothetical protein